MVVKVQSWNCRGGKMKEWEEFKDVVIKELKLVEIVEWLTEKLNKIFGKVEK